MRKKWAKCLVGSKKGTTFAASNSETRAMQANGEIAQLVRAHDS